MLVHSTNHCEPSPRVHQTHNYLRHLAESKAVINLKFPVRSSCRSTTPLRVAAQAIKRLKTSPSPRRRIARLRFLGSFMLWSYLARLPECGNALRGKLTAIHALSPPLPLPLTATISDPSSRTATYPWFFVLLYSMDGPCQVKITLFFNLAVSLVIPFLLLSNKFFSS